MENTKELIEDLHQQYDYYKELVAKDQENFKAAELLFTWDYISEKEYKKKKKKIKKKKKKEYKTNKKELNFINDRISTIQNECTHVHEDGKSAFIYDGYDSHYEWYVCEICGFIKKR